METMEMSLNHDATERTGLIQRKGSCSDLKKTILKYTLLFIIIGLAAFLGVLAAVRATSTSTTSRSIGQSLWRAITGETAKSDNPSLKFDIGMRNDYLLQDCIDNNLKRSFPNVDYVLLGYHILKGYPLATGHDPGFTSPIFKADYSNQRQTADCRFSVPNGYTIIPDVSCETDFTSEVIKNSQQLKDAMEVSTKAEGGGWGVSFAASSDFKKSSESMQSGEKVYVLSKATCQYYFAQIDEVNPPPFDSSFVERIKKLNNSKSIESYIDFISYYGTHFVKKITFGARFMKEHSMSTSTYSSLSSNSLSVEAQASYGALGFHASVSAGLSKEQQNAVSKFQQSVETKTITVGSAPPQDGDAMTWASTVKEAPIPFRYGMSSIENIFQPAYMKHHPDIDMKKLRRNIQFVKTRYSNQIYTQALLDKSGCRVFNAPFQLPTNVCLKDNSYGVKSMYTLLGLQLGLQLSQPTCNTACLHNRSCIGYSLNDKSCTSILSNGSNVIDISAGETDGNCDTRVYPYKLPIKTSSHLMRQSPGKLLLKNLKVENLDDKLNCTKSPVSCDDRCVQNITCIMAFQVKNNQNTYCCGQLEQYKQLPVKLSDDSKEYLVFIKTDC